MKRNAVCCPGIEAGPLASDGSALTSARKISTTVIGGEDADAEFTLAKMQFGQFLSHDIELAGIYELSKKVGTRFMETNRIV